MESLIIGIAGGSGSGKSTFTNRIKKRFGDDVVVLYHDNYYRRQDGIPFEQRVTVNYDHPDSLETELLVEHLKQLKTLYNYISPNKFVSPFDKIWGNIYGKSGVTSIAGISNPNYPKESYEDFITKMIEKKKKKIEKVLDLK